MNPRKRFSLSKSTFTLALFGSLSGSSASLLLAPPAQAIIPGSAALSQPINTTNATNATNAPVVSDDGYLLGAGDRIKLDFFSVPEFSGEYIVLPNGAINLPQVGMLMVQGYTTEQATKLLVDRYSAILTRPIITFNVTATRPMTVAIAGEVERPGAYALTAAGAANDSPTLSRAIQIADGVTRAADLQRVQIRRRRSGNQGEEVITVNLLQLVRSGDSRQDLRLRDGDSIVIPAGESIDVAQAKQLMASSFAGRNQRPIQVSMIGEVARTGPHLLQLAGAGTGGVLIPTVTQAIQQSGGILQMADIRNVQVRRMTRSGTEQSIKVDFWKLLKSGDLNQDIPLQDGDVIEIPTAQALNDAEITALAVTTFSPDKMTVTISGEVEKSGPLTLPPNTPLNQAILMAGGFNRKSVKSNVTLVRLNPNGALSKRDIPINLDQGVNETNNPALRNNDIIIVKKSGLATFSEGLGDILSPFNGLFSIFRLFGR